uniref:Uncharacterized protein n=1 Tax=Romanomermis culicivorax TaxID=13658 RepID=A0A915I8I4_ROMCU
MEFLVLNRFLHMKYLNKVVEESRMNCVHFWVGSFAVDAEKSDMSSTSGGMSTALCPAVRYCAGQQGAFKVKIPCFSNNSKSIVGGVICLQMVDRNKNPLGKKHSTTVTIAAKGSGANLTLDYKTRHAENVALNVTDLVDDQDYVSPKVGQEFDANNSNGVMNQKENSAIVNNETIQELDDTVANITILQVSTKNWLVKERIVEQGKSRDSSEKGLLLVTCLLIAGLIVFASLTIIARSLLKVRKIREYKVTARFCKSEGQAREVIVGQ